MAGRRGTPKPAAPAGARLGPRRRTGDSNPHSPTPGTCKMLQLNISLGSCHRPLLHHPWRRASPWLAPTHRRGQQHTRRQLPQPPACEFLPSPSPPPPRDTLACYEFDPPVERAPLCSWFQSALRGIVQCLECAPFLQLVAVRGGGPPQLTVVPIAEVITDPQVGQGVGPGERLAMCNAALGVPPGWQPAPGPGCLAGAPLPAPPCAAARNCRCCAAVLSCCSCGRALRRAWEAGSRTPSSLWSR